MAEDLLKKYTFAVDTIKTTTGKPMTIAFSQGDVKTAILIINLTENETALDLTGKKVRVSFKKSDGTSVMQDMTTGVSILEATEGKIQIELRTQTLSARGNVRGQISITDEVAGLVAETAEFTFVVRESIINTSIVSSDELPIIEEMIDASEILGEVDLQTIVNNTSNVNSLKSEVETARDGKASLKANFDEVKTQLAQKAAQSTADNLQAQISTIVLNGTSGDSSAEVAQSRVSANGVSYPTLKDHLDNIENSLKTGINIIKFNDWEVGSVSESNGSNVATTTRIRTSGYHTVPNETITIKVPSGYLVGAMYYSYTSGSYTFTGYSGWKSVDFTLDTTKGYYRFVILKNPETTATVALANQIIIQYSTNLYVPSNSVDTTSLKDKILTLPKISDDLINKFSEPTLRNNIASPPTVFTEFLRSTFASWFKIDADFAYDKIVIKKLFRNGTAAVDAQLAYIKNGVVYDFPTPMNAVTHIDGKIARFRFIAPNNNPYLDGEIFMNWDTFLKFYNSQLSHDDSTANNAFVINDSIINRKAVVYTSSDDLSYFDLAYIKNRRLTCNDTSGKTITAKYAGVDIGNGNVPTSMKAKVIWSSGTAAKGSLVLISNPNGLHTVQNITDKSFHAVFKDTDMHLDFFDGGVMTTVYTHTYATPCLRNDTTEYTFAWSVSGNTVTFTLPDGTFSFTDARIPTYMGRYCTLEHYYENGAAKPQFTYFEVLGNNFNPVKDSFKRQNGAIGIAPTGQTYVQITN